MRRRTLVLLMLVSAAPMAAELIDFRPPARLEGPARTDSALGTTYCWHGGDAQLGRRVDISVVSLPDELARSKLASPTMCVAMFAGELRKQSTDFYVESVEETLPAGPLALTQLRWTRDDGAHFSTGVTACALYKQRFVAVNFGAASMDAVEFLPLVRARLSSLKLLF